MYCDTGGFRKELKDLEQQGRIILVMFPYENINRKITGLGLPSQATLGDLKNFTLETLPGALEDYKGSEKCPAIERVVGRENRVDILHLDSAFKSQCSSFLTRDKNDILFNKAFLEELLGMRIFHSDEGWGEFLTSLAKEQNNK